MNRVQTIFAGLLVLTVSATAKADLIGEWTFDKQNLSESSGYTGTGTSTHDGEGFGSVGYAKRGNGYALDLTAANSYVRIKNSAKKNNGSADGGDNPNYRDTFGGHIFGSGGTNKMSVSFLAKGMPGGWRPFISKYGERKDTNPNIGYSDNRDWKGYGWQIRPHGDTNEAQNKYYMSATYRNTGSGMGHQVPKEDYRSDELQNFDKDAWHHYATVYDKDAGTIKMYVDGVLVLTETGVTQDMSNASHEFLAFGARDQNGGFGDTSPILMDQIRIYDHAITKADVDRLKAELPEPGTIALLALGGIGILRRRRKTA